MAHDKKIKIEKTIKPKERRQNSREDPASLSDRTKSFSENPLDSISKLPEEEQANLLAGTQSDEKRVYLSMQLQRSHGNAYVQSLLSSRAVQAKLAVSRPDDPYEREADRVAELVTQKPVAGVQPAAEEEEEVQTKVQRQPEEEEEEVQTKLQRQPEEEEEEVQTKLQRQPEEEEEEVQTKLQRQPEEEEEEVQTKLQRQPEEEEEEVQAKLQRQPEEEEEEVQAKASGVQLQSDDGLEGKINSARGSGQQLAEPVRSGFESRFGIDFSGVNVHTDARADQLSSQLKAEAFTTGQDIFFKEGMYQPDTEDGQKLIAHELTHVVQQGASTVQPQRTVDTLQTKISIDKVLGSTNKINRWGGKDHKALTETAAKDIMPAKTVLIKELMSACNAMDLRIRRLLGAAIPFIKHLFGAPVAGEGPEHGEDGNYTNPDISACAPANIALQDQHLNQAIEAKKAFYATNDKSARKKSFKQVVEHLGDSLHIAQDRGSHWEGAKGQGHDDEREKKGGYNTDDPSSTNNAIGYENAKNNTKDVLGRYEAAK